MPVIHVKTVSIHRRHKMVEYDVYVPRCGSLCWLCAGRGFGYPSGWHEYQELDACEECGGRCWLYNQPPRKLNNVQNLHIADFDTNWRWRVNSSD